METWERAAPIIVTDSLGKPHKVVWNDAEPDAGINSGYSLDRDCADNDSLYKALERIKYLENALSLHAQKDGEDCTELENDDIDSGVDNVIRVDLYKPDTGKWSYGGYVGMSDFIEGEDIVDAIERNQKFVSYGTISQYTMVVSDTYQNMHRKSYTQFWSHLYKATMNNQE